MKYWPLLIALIFTMSGCIHDKFDEPPANGEDPVIAENRIMTISDLIDLYNGAAAVELTDSLLTDSMYISAIVIADDKSGTYYKTIVLEDETAGIAIVLDVNDFFNDYPIGRRVFVLLNDLYIGQYNNLRQLGVKDPDEFDGVARIPSTLVGAHFFPGQFNIPRTPTLITIDELAGNGFSYQNRLVKIEDIEFADYELGETMADAANEISVNRDLKDCEGNTILTRNSGFASFAADSVPRGNGDLTAVFSIFGSDNQLFIREFEDIEFNNPRCGEGPIIIDTMECNPNPNTYSDVDEDFQSVEEDETIDITDWQSIPVIGEEQWRGDGFGSDRYVAIQGHNSNSSNIETWLVSPKVDFDGTQSLTFESSINFIEHDGLKVFISTDFDDCNVPLATWTELTDAVIANASNMPDGVGGFSNDFISSGEISLASYSGMSGYIGFQYKGNNSSQTSTFKIDNVLIGEPIIVVPGNCDTLSNGLDEDFESISTGASVDFELECWENIATVGSDKWLGRSFNNNYPQSIDFNNSTSPEMEMYLISPAFDLGSVSNLNFDTKIGWCNHDGLKVYISTNYDGGGNPSNVNVNWSELTTATFANASNSGDCASFYADDFIPSGNVDLSSFSGIAHIAFIYRGNNSNEKTVFQVDNVVID